MKIRTCKLIIQPCVIAWMISCDTKNKLEDQVAHSQPNPTPIEIAQAKNVI